MPTFILITHNYFIFRKKFHYLSAYAQSKLGIILFSKSLNNKLKTQSIPVQIHSIHPGIVKSNIFDNIPGSSCLPKLFFKVFFIVRVLNKKVKLI